MRAERTLLLCLTLALLGACGSSPPVRFYALDAIAAPFEASEESATIGVGPLSFPDYLKRPQIVTRSSDARLEISEFDRWGEPLDAAFTRTLTANVDALLTDTLVIEFPFGGGRVSPDYRVMGQISRFDVGADRMAVLDVRWNIETGAGENVMAPRRSLYRSPAQGADYEGVVLAMREVLEDFSRDIASSFQATTDR